MPFGIGVDVQKGKIIVVLCNFITGNFSIDDLGENTGHVSLVLNKKSCRVTGLNIGIL
jgi:hypothetical protein